MKLPLDIDSVKGFLDPQEGRALFEAALAAGGGRPWVEIGSYCGKSTVYLGTAARQTGTTLFAVDHHRGSEENQPGWEYHDTELWDEAAGALDTLPTFRDTLRRAALEDVVVPVVTRSRTLAKVWREPLGFLFIDGGHTREAAEADYRNWAPHVMPGGTLAIHDVFPNPDDGGRPPYEIYCLALASGLFEEIDAVKSLRLLRRL